MRTSLCFSLMSYGGSYDFFRPFDKEIVSSECKKLNGRIYVNLKPRTYDCRVISERRSPLSRKTAWLMIRDYGRLAGLSVEAHPHMLRHACGFALADQGADTRLIQDYLGHRNIQHTVRYT